MNLGKKIFFVLGFVLFLNLAFVVADIKEDNDCKVGEDCIIEETQLVSVLGSTISFVYVDENKIKLNIDGSISDLLYVGDVVELSNEQSIKIKEIVVPSKETEISSVVLELMEEISSEKVVEKVSEISCDSGCILGDKCYNYGYRKNGQYCSEYFNKFVNSKPDNSKCENNFECLSNLCVDGECVEAGLFKKIVNWFKRVF